MHKQFFQFFKYFYVLESSFAFLFASFIYIHQNQIFSINARTKLHYTSNITKKRYITYYFLQIFYKSHFRAIRPIFERKSFDERVSTRKGKWEKRNNVQNFRKKQYYSFIFVINRYTVIKRFVTIVAYLDTRPLAISLYPPSKYYFRIVNTSSRFQSEINFYN